MIPVIPLNPALELYDYWRGVLRYHQEEHVLRARAEHGDPVNSYGVHSFIDRDFTITFDQVTAEHLYPRNSLYPVFPDEREPMIQLHARRRGYTYLTLLMTLWPHGEFELHQPYSDVFRLLARCTFLRWTWATSHQRIVFVHAPNPSESREYSPWLNAQDFGRRQRYLPFDALCPDTRYALQYEPASRSWRIVIAGDTKKHWPPTLLADGDTAMNARYDRAQRRYNKQHHITRIKTTTTTSCVNEAAVLHVQDHLSVYPPRLKKEATR